MSGYDVDRFLNPPQELLGYLCGICQKILHKPCQCKRCISYFCFDCIKRKMCPNGCQKGKADDTLYQINKYMKNKINSTLKIRCKYTEYGCTKSYLMKDIKEHEKNCTSQAFFCPNKGCYTRIPAFKLDAHIKKCMYEYIPCSSCGFDILRKEDGNHDCVGRMLDHINKTNVRNQEISERLRNLKIQGNELRNRLDDMTTDNNNITMKLTQQVEHIEKENGSILHDISSIPSGEVTRTRQDEINELNEFDNVDQKSVSKYIKNVDNHIKEHSTEISEEFQSLQERLLDHFKFFANNVRDKFNQEVIQIGINQEFDKLSPIKNRDNLDDDIIETGENSRLSDLDSSDEQDQVAECLSPEMNEMKVNLARAYTSPLRDYQNTINTTADFRRNTSIENDVRYMNVEQRHNKSQRTTNLTQAKRREEMIKKLQSQKMGQAAGSASALGQTSMPKSARFLNAFDTHDPYPDQKFTESIASPLKIQTLTPKKSKSPFKLSKSQSMSMNGQHNVRKKKDALLQNLLTGNRNR